jgi:hypothetical protein
MASIGLVPQRVGHGACHGASTKAPGQPLERGRRHENLAGRSQAGQQLEAEDNPEEHGAQPLWPAQPHRFSVEKPLSAPPTSGVKSLTP